LFLCGSRSAMSRCRLRMVTVCLAMRTGTDVQSCACSWTFFAWGRFDGLGSSVSYRCNLIRVKY
jgi:hypothetical protein